MEIRFTTSARRHRVGRASVLHVLASTTPSSMTTRHGTAGWLYVGADERGRELEVIAVEVEETDLRPAALLVIHVMPTNLRGG